MFFSALLTLSKVELISNVPLRISAVNVIKSAISYSKCNQMRRLLRIWSHLLKKYLVENFIFVQCDLSFLKTLVFVSNP